jgi:hypothetical protein
MDTFSVELTPEQVTTLKAMLNATLDQYHYVLEDAVEPTIKKSIEIDIEYYSELHQKFNEIYETFRSTQNKRFTRPLLL